MKSTIELTSLSKTYRRRKGEAVAAVQDLSLTVPAGQVLGFLGPNGAGKTTTIKMICGLVIPDTGGVRLNGYDVQRDRKQAMQQIGAVLEGTRNVYWRLTAWQNLMYFGRLKGKSRRFVRERAEKLLKELDLWDRRSDPVGQFSRGMQQKVAVACALVADPPIVLLDEPTLGLDVQASRTIREWVRNLSQEQGKTVILTTHHLDMAQNLCDKINIMHRGRLVTDHSMADLLALHRQDNYEIVIRAPVQPPYPPWMQNLTVMSDNGSTHLTGGITDQEMLHTLLDSIRAAQLPLVSVRNIEPSLEDIFVTVIESES